MGWRDRFKNASHQEQVKLVNKVERAGEQVSLVSLVLVRGRGEKLAEGTDKANYVRQPYLTRKRLYARQNALLLRLNRRLDKFGRFASEKEVMEALKAWADDGAIQDLYSGRRKWPEQRKLIYKWARMALKAIRRHRRFGEH